MCELNCIYRGVHTASINSTWDAKSQVKNAWCRKQIQSQGTKKARHNRKLADIMCNKTNRKFDVATVISPIPKDCLELPDDRML